MKPMIRMLFLISVMTVGIYHSNSPVHAQEQFKCDHEGDTSVENAVKMFEEKYQTRVELPTKFPFKVVEKKASFKISTDHNPTRLKLCYFGETPAESIMIYVQSSDRILDPSAADKKFTLQDGTTATFREGPRSPYLLEFSRNHVSYVIGTGRKTNAVIPSNALLIVANSMSK